jgi:hypothetical protein
MEPGRATNEEQPRSRVPRGGLQIMALILAVMTLLAIYSNYQKARRDEIETVTITPAAPTAASPSPTASPTAP